MDVLMPQLGETVTEGTVSAWFKKPGDSIEVDEALLEVETDKVTTEIPALVSGILREVLVPEGETVAVGTKLAVIENSDGAATGEPVAAPAGEPQAAPMDPVATAEIAPQPVAIARASGGGQRLSPVVRRLLAEHNVDPAEITGTGDGGRITKNDVLDHVAAGKPAAASEDTRIPFNQYRKRTAQHMVRSKATSAHVLQAVEADFHEIEIVRAANKEEWKEKLGFSLTYLPFVMRAVCLAIADFPRINASVEDDSLIVHKRINLAIAVDLDFDGLVAPVIKDANDKSVRELAIEVRELATRAHDKKLGPDDMTEGTYTISNSGTFGTLITAPIINQPQVAILSSDSVVKKPVVVEGPDGDEIAIHPVGLLAQSFDHRAIDGAYSAAFLKKLKDIITEHDWLSELA